MTRKPKVAAPKTVAPTLLEACERVAAFLDTWPEGMVLALGDGVLHRPDLTALVGGCGWNLTLEQVDGTPIAAHDVVLFDA